MSLQNSSNKYNSRQTNQSNQYQNKHNFVNIFCDNGKYNQTNNNKYYQTEQNNDNQINNINYNQINKINTNFNNKIIKTFDSKIAERYQNQVNNHLNNNTNINNKNQQTQGQKILIFIGCTLIIYFFQIINGVIEQRIYKIPYKKIGQKQSNDYFNDPLTPMLFTSFFSAIIGYSKLNQNHQENEIPFKKLLKLSIVDVLIHICLILALINASYILVVMANSCGLLSVVLVNVLMPKNICKSNRFIQSQQNQYQQQQLISNSIYSSHSNKNKKIGNQKIFICFIICLGIFIFNYFTPSHHKNNQINDSTTTSVSLLTFGLLLVAILLQGLRPQYQNEIKQEYNPSPIQFYYNFNKVLCIVLLIVCIVSMKLFSTIQFIYNHDQLLILLIISSLMNSICAMFIFKIITLFRQHIYPLISTIRKCITVCISILYFGHQVSYQQIFGIIIVFSAVLLQIAINYKLLNKYNINLPFLSKNINQRYVKNNINQTQYNYNNKVIHQNNKRFQIYKNIQQQPDQDLQGI